MGKDDVTVLIGDEESAAVIPRDAVDRLRPTYDPAVAAASKSLLVLTAASRLGEFARYISEANRSHHLLGLLVRDDVRPEWLPQMFNRAQLGVLARTLGHTGTEVPARVLSAWAMYGEHESIADAAVAEDRLLVLTCAFDRHEVPFNAHRALRDLPEKERARFRIASDGAYIHWPESDIHLDVETILTILDPERKAAAEKERIAHDRAFGRAVREFRREQGIPQAGIPGLSERQLRRIEREGAFPTDEALSALATAHGLEVESYLERIAERLQLEGAEHGPRPR